MGDTKLDEPRLVAHLPQSSGGRRERDQTMPEGITLGEIDRRLAAFEKRVDERFAMMVGQLNSLQFVHRDTYVVEMAAMEERIKVQRGRIDDLEESRKWLLRVLATSLVLPVLLAVILALVLNQ